MKNVLLIALFAAAISVSAHAENTYGPTLKSVVVLYDYAGEEYSPFLFHSIMGVYLNMKMDSSCETIRVLPNKTVQCHSANQGYVDVGTVTVKEGNQGDWTGYNVNWSDKVRIVEEVSPQGGFDYSLQYK